ncbi:hypothetical protein AA0312_0725 [Acetobacter tropicalis NRIC 0312]|uniref:Uncharacterized protein n=2 Tax=Acetobacter tropicalis TaxID=104102 RepID=A0A511FPN2_9PROT|nr:hypothetical protein GOX2358 [Acetobacter tropicalis]GBR68048.1 hypothetical protein AA0312_0725 [Acetobacter tropicalis NRIC 0312]GEL50869.1 hypothetical protein ATR01nite_19440 [Acetobacter tropicalis]
MSMTENVLSSVPFSTLAQTQVQAAYPARYYAGYDTAATQPTPVTAWYDTWSMSSVDGLPPASQLLAVSSADWANTTGFRLPAGKAVQNGAIVDYTAPPLPLATQAARVLQQAASTSWATYGMYGETPPVVWQSYLASLRALANGTDTTSTQLPTPPDISAAAFSATTHKASFVQETAPEHKSVSNGPDMPDVSAMRPSRAASIVAGQGA